VVFGHGLDAGVLVVGASTLSVCNQLRLSISQLHGRILEGRRSRGPGRIAGRGESSRGGLTVGSPGVWCVGVWVMCESDADAREHNVRHA